MADGFRVALSGGGCRQNGCDTRKLNKLLRAVLRVVFVLYDDLLSATIETPGTFHSGSDEVFDVLVGDATWIIRLTLQPGLKV